MISSSVRPNRPRSARHRSVATFMALLAIVPLAIVNAAPASAEASCLLAGCVEWSSRYNGPGNDIDAATATAVSPDGARMFVTGLSFSNSTSFDYATVAYDTATGAQQWTARYDGASSFDNARDIEVSPDGSTVYVTGVSMGSGTSRDYATVAYDAATGAQMWASRYDHIGLVDFAHELEVGPDGKIFVTGESSGGSATAFDFATVAYNPDGMQAWVSRYNGPAFGADKAYAIAVAPDGSTVAATGQSFDPASSWDVSTVAYNASTGAQLWAQQYNGTNNAYDVGAAITASADSSRYFVGASSDGPNTGWDAVTISYDASTGTASWTQRFNGPQSGTDAVNDIVATPDGSKVVVVGTTVGSNGSTDLLVQARDAATGAASWTKTVNGPGNGGDTAAAVTASQDGSRVYVGGDMNMGQPNGFDIAALGLNASTGDVDWSATHNGAASREDYATSLALSSDGTWLYLGGATWNGGAEDYAAVAFRAVSADVPSEPLSLSAAPGEGIGETALTWEAPVDDGEAPVTAYRVYRSGLLEESTLVAEVDAGTLSYTDSGLVPVLPYSYQVTAVNAIGEGPASNVACTPAAPWVDVDPVQCIILG